MLTGVGLVSQVFGFLYRIAMARLVGAQVLGLYQLIMPAYSVAQSICISGLAVAASLLSSEFHARNNEAALGQLMSTGLRGLVGLWLPVALTMLFQSEFIATRLLGDGRTRLGLVLLLPVLLLTGVENLQKQQFYGIGAMRLPAGVELGEQVIRSLVIILLLALLAPEEESLSVALIVAGLLVSEVFSSAALTWGRLGRRSRQKQLPGKRVEPAWQRRRMAGIAVPVSLTALAGNLMGAATSVLIPQLLVLHGLEAGEAMEAFGILLGMTIPLLMFPTAFINALSLALLPRLTGERELGHMGDFRRTGEKAMLSVSYVVLPLIALIAALGPQLGQLLFGEVRAGNYILPLAMGVGAGCYHAVLGCMLNALGKQNQNAAISLFCGALELLLTVALTPKLGLGGFVASFVAADLLAVALCLWVARRGAGVYPGLFRCFAAPALSALLAGLLARLGCRLSLDAGGALGWSALVWGFVGLAVYLGAMAAQGFRPRAVVGIHLR